MLLRLLVVVHLASAAAALVVLAVVLGMAVPRALGDRQPPRLYRRLHRVAAALIGMALVSGALLFAGQQRPGTDLHFVYAAAALLVMPIAGGLSRRDPARARVYQVAGTLLLSGVIFRLMTTG